jgi:hypothetical protein
MITFLLTFSGISSVHALDGSRFFTWFILFSGVGSSFAGVITHGQAEKIYDEYLHSAAQSDMNRLIDDYSKKHQQSIIATRTGIGLTIGAILISLIDASHIPQPSVQNNADSFGLRSLSDNNLYTDVDLNNKEIRLGINRSF